MSKHHKDTHTAAVLDTRTGGVLARITVSTDRDGSAALVALAEQHSGLRAWASEGRPGNLGRNRSRASGAPRALRTAERHDLAVTHQRQVSAAS